MTNKGHALARDELIRVLTAYSGVTTEDGNIGGTTLIDINLKDNPSISEYAIKEKTILIMSGDAIMEDKGAASFVNATGTITLQGTGFSTRIKAGTTFRILNISSVEIDVADIDTKIGAEGDPAGTSTLFAWLAKIFDAADVAAIEAKLDGASGLVAIKAVVDAILVDTETTLEDKLDAIAAYVDTEVAAIEAKLDKTLFSMDFWSDPVEEVQLGDAAAGATVALPTVTIADLPATATIVRAIAMFKFRMIENTNAAANKLNGATVAATSQVIQVDDSGATGYVDAINFVDDQFGVAAETREGGDVLIGSIDIATRVDGNDTYSVRWLLGRADLDYLNFNDCAVGLRIWYSV